jgi:hypothetical protein
MLRVYPFAAYDNVAVRRYTKGPKPNVGADDPLSLRKGSSIFIGM